MDIGTKIRSLRLSKGVSQKELSEGICSQGMLSQIEKNKHTPNFHLLAKICKKMEVKLDDLNEYTTTELTIKKNLKEELAVLFYQRKYEEIYVLIKSNLNSYFYTPLDKQLLLFYKALYYGFTNGKYHKAYEILEKALYITYYANKKSLSYEEIIIFNNLGIFALKMEMLEEGFHYLEIILQDIDTNLKIENNSKITLIYFNVANAYSKYGYYEKALKIAIKGIQWANKSNINTQLRLSHLYYEKAYNEQMLNEQNYIESYKTAYYLALNAKDDNLLKFIKSKISID
ncbi:helix-turn-helix transcriptional regulator [Viridibacillus sp. YIM B01967]|uniref:Helix-turn-helix transcriptional regulator n=1 Tax=Viridibacillus soli TaxID=2798301 RepID=A0ABS1H5R6_9BACL|nr:helix-turn-helix transcriptional regulator [Viridibacillus soli]MBK3494755.1 helix-turn-helix transcriptional regulator [Viridibacillus soli]